MDRQPSQMLSGTGGTGSRPTSPTQMVPLYDKDLIRMFAEVNFIQGEVRSFGHMFILTHFKNLVQTLLLETLSFKLPVNFL